VHYSQDTGQININRRGRLEAGVQREVLKAGANYDFRCTICDVNLHKRLKLVTHQQTQRGRNGIGRKEKWPKIVGRREKSGRKCREEGENEMLGVGRDGRGGDFVDFFSLRDGKGFDDDPLGSPETPLVGLDRESMESNFSLFFFIECYYIHLHVLLHTLFYVQFHTFTLFTHKYYIYPLIYIYLH